MNRNRTRQFQTYWMYYTHPYPQLSLTCTMAHYHYGDGSRAGYQVRHADRNLRARESGWNGTPDHGRGSKLKTTPSLDAGHTYMIRKQCSADDKGCPLRDYLVFAVCMNSTAMICCVHGEYCKTGICVLLGFATIQICGMPCINFKMDYTEP